MLTLATFLIVANGLSNIHMTRNGAFHRDVLVLVAAFEIPALNTDMMTRNTGGLEKKGRLTFT